MMKYLAMTTTFLTLICTGLVGYLYFNPGFLLRSLPNEKAGNQIASNEIDKLYNELSELRDVLSEHAISIGKLENADISNGTKIDWLEKKMQELRASLEDKLPANVSASSSPANLFDPSKQNISTELFKDAEFAKLFQSKVEETVKNIQQKQREEMTKRMTEERQKTISKRMEEFAKAQNLNDFQQQEMNKLITERESKMMELFDKERTQEITREEARTKIDNIRNESNENIKQILSSQQYEAYQKIENTLGGGMMGGRGIPPGQGNTPPSQPGQ